MKKILISVISIIMMCMTCTSVFAVENANPVQTETQEVTQENIEETKSYDWSSNTTGNSNLIANETVLIENGKYQFISVSTYTDDVFYIIIDKTKTEDNVYFLNEVDTYDILKLVSDDDDDKDDSTVSTNSNNKSNNKNDDEQNPTSSDTETENNNTTSNEKPVVDTTSIVICIVLVVGGIGAFLFIKFVYGPKKQKQNSEIFEDDFEEERTINEDKE